MSNDEATATGIGESLPERKRRRRFGGLLVQRYRWGLSLRGWVTFLVTAIAAAAVLFLGAYPFLAITQRVNARVLVVEGWVHQYGINAAVEEFRLGSYDKVYTTGGPTLGKGGYINDFNTSASVGADELKKAGLPSNKLQMVPSRVMGRDRTYSSAVALRDWWGEHGIAPASVNVLTEDTHARRSRLLFREALGRDVAVGIIAVRNPDFDSRRWWRYSEGLQEVIGETLGYVYAKFLFYPSRAEGRWKQGKN